MNTINDLYKYKTEFYEEEDIDRPQYSVYIDGCDYGTTSISILKKEDEGLMHKAENLIFDRETSVEIVNKIIKLLAEYPKLQSERIDRGYDCCCKERHENKSK